MTADPRLCLALDVPGAIDAEYWVKRTTHVFGCYKIGLQLFCAEGPDIVARARRAGAGRVFLDLKLHDIPNTVVGAIRSLARVGVDDLTVHIAGGSEMLRAAADAAHAAGVHLLGVTVLTSLDRASLAATGTDRDPAEVVVERARLALDSGLSGLVCSAREVAPLRDALGASIDLVTPGIRLAGHAAGDQKRVTTPAEALADGASRIVIGRTITGAADVDEALDALRRACTEVPAT